MLPQNSAFQKIDYGLWDNEGDLQNLTSFVKKFECKPVCGVIMEKIRTSSLNAALANGTVAHALDYDDTCAGLQGHPSVPLFPAVMALGEELGCSGKEIITTYVLGG